MPDLIGRSLGRYRIVELLGAGGMGEVYRAHDTKLQRDVAIKVLSDDITQNRKHLERFEREARTLAQLSHPNILAIHDFRTDDGIVYAVEELLEGRDLRREIARGKVPQERVIEIISAVAEGLGAAHRKGILHRDIKPENIFVLKNGGVKILDFGLARSFGTVNPDGPTKTEPSDLTAPGTIIGTMSYLSPEQARGEALTPHSDVFSLGCVFYELLTGVHPFRKDTGVETMVAILNENPPRPSAVDPSIPPALDGIIARCLEKSPDERFESARDIAFAIKALSGPHTVSSGVWGISEAPKRRRSRALLAAVPIVVLALVGAFLGVRAWAPEPLPEVKQITVARFEAVDDDPETELLAAGLSEVVARGLEIVAEDSPEIGWVETWRFGKRRVGDDLGQAFRDFNLSLGVVGRFEVVGDFDRLVLEVVDTEDGSVLRRTEVKDRLGNPYAFQVNPVIQLAEVLGVQVDDETVERIRAQATDVPPALDSYLRGSGGLALAKDAEGARTALGLLENATERDPIFIQAEVATARACLEISGHTEDRGWLVRGVERVERVAAAPSPVEAMLVLAALRNVSGDIEGEIDALRRAVEFHPVHGEARRNYAAALKRAGLMEEAERQYQRAIYLQPGYWPNHHYLAEIFTNQGRFDAAATEYRRVVELAPLYVGGYINLGATYAYLGRFDLSREVYEQSLIVDSAENYVAYSNLGTLYEMERRFADSAAMLEKALGIDDSDYQVWGNLGWVRKYAEGDEASEAPFRNALELAGVELAQRTNDPELLCDMAGYHAGLGEREDGLVYATRAAAIEPNSPVIVGSIAEVFEDLNDRERALEWVERAFSVGVSPSEFENNPTLRDLVADERYRELVTRSTDLGGA